MINEHVVRSGDAELFVRAAGGGPDADTLVVLHGGPGLSHEYLIDLFELATSELRVVAYDQRGVGRSTGTVDVDLLSRQVDDLAAVQEVFGGRCTHLLGHSAGSLTAVLAAAKHPQSVASVIFVDSAPATRAGLNDALAAVQVRIGELTSAGVITPPADPNDPTGWVGARRVPGVLPRP